MLSEDNQLLARRRLGRRNGRCSHRRRLSLLGLAAGGEDLAKQAGQFAPFSVLAAAAHGERQRFKAAKRRDLSFELVDRARRRRLVEDLLLGSLDLVIRRFLKILHVIGIERWSCGGEASAAAAALQDFEFPQALLQPFAAPAQRLVDGLGRRRQSPLQDGERKPDRPGPLIIGKRLGAIELRRARSP